MRSFVLSTHPKLKIGIFILSRAKDEMTESQTQSAADRLLQLAVEDDILELRRLNQITELHRCEWSDGKKNSQDCSLCVYLVRAVRVLAAPELHALASTVDRPKEKFCDNSNKEKLLSPSQSASRVTENSLKVRTTMTAHDQMRAMLDQLMGTARNGE